VRVFDTVQKQLGCPACGELMAQVSSRLFPPVFVVHARDGSEVTPLSGAVLQRIAEQEMAAASGAARQEATARRDFVKRNSAELIYDLRCPNDHVTMRTRPQIVTAMRRTPGQWVSLG
jgi:hypothetical protein